MSLKIKVTALLTTFCMVISLLVVSCGQDEVKDVDLDETHDSDSVVISDKTVDTVTTKDEDKKSSVDPSIPKYGGIHTSVYTPTVPGWDPGTMQAGPVNHIRISNESLVGADWAKGLAGTGETDWKWGYMGLSNLLTGWLAESWEYPDDETLVFHIRPGVHWWDKEPVNGREFTAYDAEFAISREWDCAICYPRVSMPENQWPISIKALDKYTLELKVPPMTVGLHLFQIEWIRMIPPEVVEQYGNMNDWKNVIGTGAYMLTDYVPGSVLTYERNPDYWQYDPIHPENRLPYLDGLKWLNISDSSAIQAGFRTGKIDVIHSVSAEDKELFLRDKPDLMYAADFEKMITVVAMRVDKEDLPFKDVRVRRALNIAIDKVSILEDYYGGGALLAYPFLPTPAFQGLYVPLEEMPETVQELFKYDPDKAKALLAEAGYPEGFKTEIIIQSAQSDLMSIIKEYFSAVGVDMTLTVLEGSSFIGVFRSRNHSEMIWTTTYPYSFWKLAELRIEHGDDRSFYDNPKFRAVYEEVVKNVGVDDAKVKQLIKDNVPAVLDEAPYIWLPAGNKYNMWWPWVQNYTGEINFGSGVPQLYRIWLWHDETLKKSMGY